jgi:hypothetical protein
MDAGSEPVSIEIREATEEEAQALALSACVEGMERRVWIAIDGAEIVGHIALSMGLGQCFGHDTKYWGPDTGGAARLWLRARRAARELGFDAVLVHMGREDPMKAFWERQGFEFVTELYRGVI